MFVVFLYTCHVSNVLLSTCKGMFLKFLMYLTETSGLYDLYLKVYVHSIPFINVLTLFILDSYKNMYFGKQYREDIDNLPYKTASHRCLLCVHVQIKKTSETEIHYHINKSTDNHLKCKMDNSILTVSICMY